MVATGHVYTSEYEDRDANRRSSTEMRATAVGPDLSRVFVRIEKPSYTGPAPEETPAAATAAPGAADGDTAAEEQPGSDDVAVGDEPLPLSA